MKFRCETDRVVINRQQLQSLLASQRAFQDSISTIIDILQEPSKSVYYQSCLRDCLEDPPTEKSLARGSTKNNDDDHSHYAGDTASINAEARSDVASQSPGVRMFEVENARARKMYVDKQKSSLNRYNRAGALHLSREYHFQCERSSSFRSKIYI